MLLSILVWFSRDFLADCLCMQLGAMKACHKNPYDNPDISVREIPLRECVDKCFANFDRVCTWIQWNTITRECYMSKSWKYPKAKSKSCLYLTINTACYGSTEEYCFQNDTSGQIAVKGYKLEDLDDETDCRTLCRIGTYCTGYVWDPDTHTCTIPAWKRGKYRQLAEDENKVVKKKPCPEGRCAVLYSSAIRQNRELFHNAKTLYECLEHILKRQDLYQLIWDPSKRECRVYDVHISKYSSGMASHKSDLIRVTESKECNLNPGNKEVCLRRQENAKMKDGLRLRVAEEDCPKLCKKIRNCAAVDWDSSGQMCMFHYVAKTLQRGVSGYTNFKVIDCDAEKGETFVTIVGVIIFSHYTRQVERSLTPTPMRNILEGLQCAMSCSKMRCSGFRLSTSPDERGALCQVETVSNPTYKFVV